MILADTSVWVDHLRKGSAMLAARLEEGEIACHPFVIGELALGSLRRRGDVLALLADLPRAAVIPHDDVLALVERKHLAGRGIGWVDAHLMASALADGSSLWTLDRRLRAAASALGLAV